MIQWRNIISFDFHHIPKLSIGFKYVCQKKSNMHGLKSMWSEQEFTPNLEEMIM